MVVMRKMINFLWENNQIKKENRKKKSLRQAFPNVHCSSILYINQTSKQGDEINLWEKVGLFLQTPAL